MTRPKLEQTIVLERNPVPLVVWDFNVAVFHVIKWYEKISGSFKKEVEETASKVMREPAPDPAEEDWNAFASPSLGRNP
jgi:hypothetical protein